MQQQYQSFLHDALAVLTENNLLNNIEQVTQFFDDPQVFQYSSTLNTERIKKQTGQFYDIHALGCSFSSKELALTKCLGESIERLCSYLFSEKKIIHANSIFRENYLLPYFPDKIKKNDRIGLMRGYNITNNSVTLIPAQLIYISYALYHREEQITEPNTTGAAGGFSHESVLLRGIYEIVERDAFMTMYLGTLKPIRVAIEKLRSQKIQTIIQHCQRYNLSVYLFDITNDLGIPTFVTLLIDTSGLGPAVTFGLKASMRVSEAILGSLEESFVTRYSLRRQLLQNNNDKHSPEINMLFKRGILWSSVTMLKQLNFLLNQKPDHVKIPSFHSSLKEELQTVIDIFRKMHMTVLYADITQDMFRRIPYMTYKVVIPALQPLYLFEENKVIRQDRLEAVARYYKQVYKLNPVPHPIL